MKENSHVIDENGVSQESLVAHLDEAGWDVACQGERLVLHSPRGLGFSIRLDGKRQFVVLACYLPVKKDFPDGLELVNLLNEQVFLGGFSLDRDNDLCVSYAMSFERGLIRAQFSRVVLRFSSMLEHVVEHFDREGRVFALDRDDQEESQGATAPAPPSIQ